MLRLHSQCDRGMSGYVYPDGRALLDQPLILLSAFAVIGDQVARLKRPDAS